MIIGDYIEGKGIYAGEIRDSMGENPKQLFVALKDLPREKDWDKAANYKYKNGYKLPDIRELSQIYHYKENNIKAGSIADNDLSGIVAQMDCNRTESACLLSSPEIPDIEKVDLQQIANMELRDQLEAKDEMIKKRTKQLKTVVMALRWYEGLEIMLPYWEILTGQPRGTAEKALKEAEELDK